MTINELHYNACQLKYASRGYKDIGDIEGAEYHWKMFISTSRSIAQLVKLQKALKQDLAEAYAIENFFPELGQ